MRNLRGLDPKPTILNKTVLNKQFYDKKHPQTDEIIKTYQTVQKHPRQLIIRSHVQKLRMGNHKSRHKTP